MTKYKWESEDLEIQEDYSLIVVYTIYKTEWVIFPKIKRRKKMDYEDQGMFWNDNKKCQNFV